uniref:Odorant receptor n=1 Tax=Sirex nitobei TaxID=1602346 RepID=A0A857N9Z3_9HYME|nr:odorant receptor 7 [Sirex nitobei]
MDVESILRPSRLFFVLVGFWPSENKKKPKLCRIKTYLIGIFVVTLAIDQCRTMLTLGTDAASLAEYSVDAVGLIVMSTKVIPFVVQRDSLLSMLSKTNGLSKHEEASNGQNIVKHWKLRHTIAVKYLTRLYLIVLVTYISAPLILQDKGFPLRGNFPSFIVNTSWYILAYVTESIMLSLATSGVLVCDMLLILFVCDLCSELNCTALLLEELGQGQRDFTTIVEKHVAALNYGKSFCDVTSVVFLFQAIVTTSAICLAGYTAMKTTSTIILTKMLMVLLTTMMQLFINCYIGEIITEAFLIVRTAIEDSDWLFCPSKDQKGAFLILLRTEKPLRLGVGTFGVMNLKSFTEFMYNALSYLAVLNTMIRGQ